MFPVAVGWGSLVKVTWSIRQLLLSVALLNGGESIDLNTLKIVRSVCGRLKIRCYSDNGVIQKIVLSRATSLPKGLFTQKTT